MIGERVRLYQGVTLGARGPGTTSGSQGRPRHPIVEDDVAIYAGATILGRVTIGRGSSIGGNVWLTRAVPPGEQVTQAQRGGGRRRREGGGGRVSGGAPEKHESAFVPRRVRGESSGCLPGEPARRIVLTAGTRIVADVEGERSSIDPEALRNETFASLTRSVEQPARHTSAIADGPHSRQKIRMRSSILPAPRSQER